MSNLDKKFEEEFKDFDYIFTSLDERITKMSKGDKIKYFKDATKMTKNKAFYPVIDDILKQLYSKLAIEERVEWRQSYKGALLFGKMYRQYVDRMSLQDPYNQEISKFADELLEDN